MMEGFEGFLGGVEEYTVDSQAPDSVRAYGDNRRQYNEAALSFSWKKVPYSRRGFSLTGFLMRVQDRWRMARILVIDDEPQVLVVVEQMLRSAGHDVVLAADGREGLRRYREGPHDLIICDLFMPELDGLE